MGVNVEESVRELLYFHDCVIIPQFGAFVSNYVQSQAVGELPTQFTPPSKRLIFNNKLTHNDGLLLNYLVQNHTIGFNDAATLVQKHIWDLEQTLSREGAVEYGTLGSFVLENGVRAFEPVDSETLLADSFGLGAFSFKPISNKPTVRLKRKVALLDLSYQVSHSKFAKPVLYVLPFVIAGTLLKPYFDQGFQSSSFDFLANTEVPVAVPVEHQATVEEIDKHLDEENNQRNALVYAEPEYHIIVGSFKDQVNAIKFLDNPVFGKFTSELIYTNNLYRVSVGKYMSKDTAKRKLVEMRVRNRELKDAWIFCKK